MRHKDYGIWQSWTWASSSDEVRALALGLQALGLKAGDKIAVVGANRPRLYWTFAAVQALGGVPVPVYADAVAEEMAYVLDHAGVRFAVVQDQEQVDKIQSFAAEIPNLSLIIYDEPRGLARLRSAPACTPSPTCRRRGAALLARRSRRSPRRWERASARPAATTFPSSSTRPAPPAARRA